MVNGVRRLLAGGVLGDGLGSLRNCVLGKLSREDEADSGLDFAGRDRGALVVVGQTGGLGGDALEDVVHERVHDGHRLAGYARVGVDLQLNERINDKGWSIFVLKHVSHENLLH